MGEEVELPPQIREQLMRLQQLQQTLQALKKEKLSPKQVVQHPRLPKGYWPADKQKPTWFDYCIAAWYQSIPGAK